MAILADLGLVHEFTKTIIGVLTGSMHRVHEFTKTVIGILMGTMHKEFCRNRIGSSSTVISVLTGLMYLALDRIFALICT